MTSKELDKTVDLLKVMERAWGAKDIAATRIIADGQLTVDGHVVLPQWATGHWTVRQLRGRMLACPQRGSYRLFGGEVAA